MKLTAYIKDILREFKNSITKVLSILIMIVLGALVITGLGHTGQSMRDSLDYRLDDMDAPDIIVSSTFGLDYEDQAIIESTSDLEDLVYSYQLDVYNGDDEIIRLHSMEGSMPTYSLTEGRKPENKDEIALDSYYARGKYQLGDKISFRSINDADLGDSLDRRQYEIVGFVESPQYLMDSSRGNSPLGKSNISGFAIIFEDNFRLENYSSAYLKFEDTESYHRTSDQYLAYLDEKKIEIEDRLSNRPEDRLAEIRQDVDEEIEEIEKDLQEAERELTSAEEELLQANEEIDNKFKEYEDAKSEFDARIAAGQSELDQAKYELDQAKKRLDQGWADYQAGQDQLNSLGASAKEEIDQGKSQLVNAKVKIDQGWADYNKALNELEEGFAPSYEELEASRLALQSTREDLDQAWAQYTP